MFKRFPLYTSEKRLNYEHMNLNYVESFLTIGKVCSTFDDFLSLTMIFETWCEIILNDDNFGSMKWKGFMIVEPFIFDHIWVTYFELKFFKNFRPLKSEIHDLTTVAHIIPVSAGVYKYGTANGRLHHIILKSFTSAMGVICKLASFH